MERKRKLPARAAARSEQNAKKRNVTPRERSATPVAAAPVVAVAQPPEDPPPPPLPTSIQAGKPLPTVENAQSDSLTKDYQSVGESGVAAESLIRSRHKWIGEGLFEKYWTKPHKRKGVLNEDPKNPPKDSMTKVGTVTITIEPHVIEATMYAVKESKLRPQQSQQQQQPATRPILQYGPPNGSMPPPPTPNSSSATPAPGTTTPDVKPATLSPAPTASQTSPRIQQSQNQSAPTAPTTSSTSMAPSTSIVSTAPIANNPTPSPSPGLATRHPISGPSVPPAASPPPPRAPSNLPMANAMHQPTASPLAQSQPRPSTSAAPTTVAPLAGQATSSMIAAPPRAPMNPIAPPVTGFAKPTTPSPHPIAVTASKPAATDPVIALLAQKASGDAELRDLMKRVAVGQAKDGELAHFQTIIDTLNAEYKRRGGQQGPSADRLLVDGRTVKYFADEVRTILDIVLASNPKQKSTDLRPPPRSDPLVVLLVKTALEDLRTKEMIRRIADGRPGYTDATDLKEILDRLHRDMKTVPQGLSTTSTPVKQPTPNGLTNGHGRTPSQSATHPNQQALRSKGPPPTPKPDISAVLFDFGTGDRYLFPKFSILEYLPTPSGQQVVASFLIVRKGSMSEYDGDPKLDYYQPLTIRLCTQTGRHLENLARVVAPQDEVRRYMDDVMDNMTRAEYVLLAMRLPKNVKDGDKDAIDVEESKTGELTAASERTIDQNAPTKMGVLWDSKSKSNTPASERALSKAARGQEAEAALNKASSKKARSAEEEQETGYQRLIKSVTAKEARH